MLLITVGKMQRHMLFGADLMGVVAEVNARDTSKMRTWKVVLSSVSLSLLLPSAVE